MVKRSISPKAFVSSTLLACALALAAAAVLVVLTGGGRFRIGGLTLSARDPGRLFLESSLAMLVRELLCRGSAALPCRTFALVGFFVMALVWESSPKLVGDGAEYIAMTRQFSLGRAPGLSASDAEETERFLTAFTGFEFALPVRGDLEGRDRRRQFDHFWGYSLLASPFAVAARLVGAHPNSAFTLLNALLLCGAAAISAPRIGLAATSLLLLGPAIWWVDKAHTELLTLTALTAAGALLPARPDMAIPLLGIAAAQNPPLAIVLLAVIVWVLRRPGRRPWLACLAGVGIAGLHPLYYSWTLDRMSPLAGATLWHRPGATAFLTPLLDPDLGLAWAFAGLTIGVLLVIPALLRPGHVSKFRVEAALLTVCLLALLFSFAQTPNVNHGGTPGPSRYTMWLVPLAAPLFRIRSILVVTWRRQALSVIAAISLATSALFYHPKLPQAFGQHTRLATWLLGTWPHLYNPLPEVFVERTLATDGELMIPVATPRCEKVLLGGETNGGVLWPIPCEPTAVPEPCRAPGTLCYGNRSPGGYAFVRAPAQRGLPSPKPAPAWDAAHRAGWNVLGIDWPSARTVPPLSEASFVRDAEGIVRIMEIQTDRDMAAWVWTMESGSPGVVLRPPARAEWWQLDPIVPPASLPAPTGAIEEGERLSLSPGTSVLLLVRVTGGRP